MPTTTPTADGGRVETFVTADASDGSQTLHIQKFDAAGAAVGAEFDAKQFAPFLPVMVAALSSGGYAVVYGYAFRGWDYTASVFDPGGAALRTFALPGFGEGLEVAASPLGGFAIVDRDTVVGPMGVDYDGHPLVTLYDNSGAVIAPTAQLSGDLPSLSVAASGHYQLAWTDGTLTHSLDLNPATGVAAGGGGQGLTGAADTVQGGAGDDTMTGGDSSNYLRGNDGNDSIVGGTGFNDINGNKGDDTIVGHSEVGDWLVGGQGNDLITAHGPGNIVYGNLGDDTLIGGAGGDIIRGGQGDDSIVAGSGAEWISGDRGNDTIQAGSGPDTFHTSSGAGMDKVLGFDAAKGDHVQLDPGTHYTLGQVGADTVIDMGGGDEMILVGVQSSSLPPGWIFGA